jgi:hypothetical protein
LVAQAVGVAQARHREDAEESAQAEAQEQEGSGDHRYERAGRTSRREQPCFAVEVEAISAM